MKKNKIIIAIVAIIVGAIYYQVFYNNSDVKYLRKKYNESFSYYTTNIDNIPFYHSKSHPKYAVKVNEIKGKYYDNYYDILVYDELHNYLKKIMSKQLSEFKFYYSNNNNMVPEEIIDVNNLEKDIKNHPEYYETNIMVFVPESASNITETQKEQLAQSFKDRHLSYIININKVPDSEYQNLTDANAEEYAQFKILETIFSDAFYYRSSDV